MATRLRSFSVVIHDTPPEAKKLAEAVMQKRASKYIIALEPYDPRTQAKPSPTGFHLHIFYTLKNTSNKTAQLKTWQAFKWGRVQVDPQRGTHDQATCYLIAPDKQKYCDPDPIRFPNTNSKYCQCKILQFIQDRIQNYVQADDLCKQYAYTLQEELYVIQFQKRERVNDLLCQSVHCQKCSRPRDLEGAIRELRLRKEGREAGAPKG